MDEEAFAERIRAGGGEVRRGAIYGQLLNGFRFRLGEVPYHLFPVLAQYDFGNFRSLESPLPFLRQLCVVNYAQDGQAARTIVYFYGERRGASNVWLYHSTSDFVVGAGRNEAVGPICRMINQLGMSSRPVPANLDEDGVVETVRMCFRCYSINFSQAVNVLGFLVLRVYEVEAEDFIRGFLSHLRNVREVINLCQHHHAPVMDQAQRGVTFLCAVRDIHDNTRHLAVSLGYGDIGTSMRIRMLDDDDVSTDSDDEGMWSGYDTAGEGP